MTNSIKKLNSLKEQIENMSFNDHIEIYKIINKVSPKLITENKNGSYINMTKLSDETINLIQKYCDYVKIRESSINSIESEKKKLIEEHYKE